MEAKGYAFVSAEVEMIPASGTIDDPELVAKMELLDVPEQRRRPERLAQLGSSG
ncbi:MAG: hypothetical protein ACLRXC_08155 [[Clostridium] leptum]